ncbi:MAG: hypothetical protein AB1646_03485 [Thermodesulfobacteriota bacterium]
MPRKISAKDVAEDIRFGMHDNQLMVKYGVSFSQLAEMRRKLENAGLVPRTGPGGALPHGFRQGPVVMTCPSCGFGMDRHVEECPRCGRVLKRATQSASPGPMPQSSGPVPRAMGLETSSTRGQGARVIASLVVVAVAVTLVVAVGTISRKNRAQVLHQAKPTLQLIAAADSAHVDWREAAGELRDIKQRSRGFLSGWTGDMDKLLTMSTRMIKVSAANRQVLESMRRRELAADAPLQPETSGFGDPIAPGYQESRNRAANTTGKISDYQFGGQLPVSSLGVQEEYMALKGHMVLLSRKLIETK